MNLPAFAPWLGVFETLRVIEGVPLFMHEHRAELQRAATALGLPVDLDLKTARAGLSPQSGRWRWIIRPGETTLLFTEEPPASVHPIPLSISPVRVGSQNWDALFKTLSYLAHAQARQAAPTPETVLLNERAEVASAASANIFWRRGDCLYTPAHEAGCRRGIVREFVLAQAEVEQGCFPIDELLAADEIFLTSSLCGIVSINLLEGRSRADFASADPLRRKYEDAIQAMLPVLR